MKTSCLKIGLLVLIAAFAFPDDAMSQNYGKKKKKKSKSSKEKTEQVEWTQNLWYGGGFNLSFSPAGYAQLGGNTFQIGISPMAGYKIYDFLSVGPRFEVNYVTGRFQFNGIGQVYKLNAVSYGIGAFTRLKSPWNIFGHFEYDYYNDEFTDLQVTIDNKLNTFRESRDAFFLGAGYNSSSFGSKFGYEFYLVYDVLAPDNTTDLPLYYRFGLTYNF